MSGIFKDPGGAPSQKGRMRSLCGARWLHLPIRQSAEEPRPTTDQPVRRRVASELGTA